MGANIWKGIVFGLVAVLFFGGCGDESHTQDSPFPHLDSTVPTSAAAGTSITLKGKNLLWSGNNARIIFIDANGGRTDAGQPVGDNTTMTVTVPPGLAPGNYSIVYHDVNLNTDTEKVPFTVTSSGNSTSIASIVPNSGTVGATVTISGTLLGGNKAEVYFELPDGTHKIYAGTATGTDAQVTIKVPAGVSSGLNKVYIYNPNTNQFSNKVDFTVQ